MEGGPSAHGAEHDDPFLASLIPGHAVKPFSRHTLRKRFRTACKVLGPARLEMLTSHHGRHTFISYVLAGGRSLAEVRDAAGHCNAISRLCSPNRAISGGFCCTQVDHRASR